MCVWCREKLFCLLAWNLSVDAFVGYSCLFWYFPLPVRVWFRWLTLYGAASQSVFCDLVLLAWLRKLRYLFCDGCTPLLVDLKGLSWVFTGEG